MLLSAKPKIDETEARGRFSAKFRADCCRINTPRFQVGGLSHGRCFLLAV